MVNLGIMWKLDETCVTWVWLCVGNGSVDVAGGLNLGALLYC